MYTLMNECMFIFTTVCRYDVCSDEKKGVHEKILTSIISRTRSVLKLGWVVYTEVRISVVRKTPFSVLLGGWCEIARNLLLHE